MKKVIALMIALLMVLSGCSSNEVEQELFGNEDKQDRLDYLNVQVQSNKYADWNQVAKCGYATEEHLLKVAKSCASITDSYKYAGDIAKT